MASLMPFGQIALKLILLIKNGLELNLTYNDILEKDMKTVTIIPEFSNERMC